jgi:DNA processing protein
MQHLEEDIYYQIALSFVQGIGPKYATALMQKMGSAKAVLAAPIKQLLQVEGMGALRAKAIKEADVFHLADKEIAYIQSKGIQVLNAQMPTFPKRLLDCMDAPQLLYYKGHADLNALKTVAVIGTRKYTDYGQRLTNDLIEGLAQMDDLLILSGLAHGIDTIAHKAAIKHQVPTVAVLGHGLHTIYPVANKGLAQEMLADGGLLTEFASLSKVEKGNFPARNRIVAGMADLTIVVESDVKGGALITAYIAHSYHREVAAFPGRAYDHKSSGTNSLIRKQIASLVCSAQDVLDLMDWQKQKKKPTQATQLLLQLSPEEQLLIAILQSQDTTHADELLLRSKMGSSNLASCLLLLEMQGLIKSLPGKRYRMN